MSSHEAQILMVSTSLGFWGRPCTIVSIHKQLGQARFLVGACPLLVFLYVKILLYSITGSRVFKSAQPFD